MSRKIYLRRYSLYQNLLQLRVYLVDEGCEVLGICNFQFFSISTYFVQKVLNVVRWGWLYRFCGHPPLDWFEWTSIQINSLLPYFTSLHFSSLQFYWIPLPSGIKTRQAECMRARNWEESRKKQPGDTLYYRIMTSDFTYAFPILFISLPLCYYLY